MLPAVRLLFALQEASAQRVMFQRPDLDDTDGLEAPAQAVRLHFPAG